MRDSYEPSGDPTFWAFRPVQAAGDPYQHLPVEPGADPAAARAKGLRRLGRLTWRATQLSALGAVGFATVFARTAPAPVASSTAPPPHSAKLSAAAPSSSASHQKARAVRHVRARHAARPAAHPTAAPAATPTLAPPTTKPAPPPPTHTSAPPPPTPTVSSTSHSGGG